MEAPGILVSSFQDQGQVIADLKMATTGVLNTGRISLWKKLKQVCGAGRGVDPFDANSFDHDAKALDDDDAASSSCSADDGSLEEKAVGE